MTTLDKQALEKAITPAIIREAHSQYLGARGSWENKFIAVLEAALGKCVQNYLDALPEAERWFLDRHTKSLWTPQPNLSASDFGQGVCEVEIREVRQP